MPVQGEKGQNMYRGLDLTSLQKGAHLLKPKKKKQPSPILFLEPVVLQKPALKDNQTSVQQFFTSGFSAMSLLLNQLFQKDKKNLHEVLH